MRRLMGLIVTGKDVGVVAKSGRRMVEVMSTVPETATFFSSYFDPSRNAFVVLFEDKSFSLLAEGSAIPLCRGNAVVSEPTIIDQLNLLPEEERLEILKAFCGDCGSNNHSCQCSNDE